MDDAEMAISGDRNQYVTFTVDDRAYGVDIMAVREIRQWSKTTELPNQARHGRGVIDIRGRVATDGALTAWEMHNFNSGPQALSSPWYATADAKTAFHPATGRPARSNCSTDCPATRCRTSIMHAGRRAAL